MSKPLPKLLGDITQLTTTNKTDIVSAINEHGESLAEIPNQTYITNKALQSSLDATNTNVTSNANNIATQKSRIDTLVQTSSSSFYQKSTSGTTGALLVVSSGATTGQINLANVTPVATGYIPVAGDYVLLVYGVASGSAELIDGRTNKNSVTFGTLGNRINADEYYINYIKSILLNQYNLFDNPLMVESTQWIGNTNATCSYDYTNLIDNYYTFKMTKNGTPSDIYKEFTTTNIKDGNYYFSIKFKNLVGSGFIAKIYGFHADNSNVLLKTLTSYNASDTLTTTFALSGYVKVLIQFHVININSLETVSINFGKILLVNTDDASNTNFDNIELLNQNYNTLLQDYNNLNLSYKNDDVLNNKKATFGGDSITYGAYANVINGIPQSYPEKISARHNITLVNEAVSGSTITNMNIEGVSAFSDTRYKAISSDSDYIMLMFGTNDALRSANIGTITDTDTSTFYGAWNTVLNYIITNYLLAKIGIILPIIDYNTYSAYLTAVRNIANKYGIRYLDWYDNSTPLFFAKPGVDSSIISLRYNSYFADGVHPGDNGYNFMSTIVENFMRTL